MAALTEGDMHRAKGFFYACAGVFLLALSYHLGARDAAGQPNGNIEAVGYDNGALFGVVDGAWMLFDRGSGTPFVRYPLPVPGAVVGVGDHIVVYRNGDVYEYRGSPGAWVRTGNFHEPR